MSAGFSQNQRSTGGHRPPLQQTKTALRQFCNTLNLRGDYVETGGHVSPIRLILILCVTLFTVQLLAGAYHTPVQVHHGEYFPLRDNWERRKPADVGMDAAKLNAAV